MIKKITEKLRLKVLRRLGGVPAEVFHKNAIDNDILLLLASEKIDKASALLGAATKRLNSVDVMLNSAQTAGEFYINGIRFIKDPEQKDKVIFH